MEAALPRAKGLMQTQGELLEADFDVFEIPQDEGYDEIRDTLPLGRRRALVLTSKHLAERCAQQRADKEAETERKTKSAEMKRLLKEKKETYLKALAQGPCKKISKRSTTDPDVFCLLCCVSFYALEDHGLAKKLQDTMWKQCMQCNEWMCPFCVKNMTGASGHEKGCKLKFAAKARPSAACAR